MSTEVKSIAFLGLGAMGSRMALKLVKAGHDVTVWNRSQPAVEALASAGAKPAATPLLAASWADFVISMLTDDAASRAVWLDASDGACRGLRPGAIAIECSTVTPGWVGELEQAVSVQGASLVDAPVSGSRPQADAAQLVFMIGGASDAVEKALPVLKPMGAAFHHMGDRGMGATFKLAVNALFAAQLASIAELLSFLRMSGIDVARIVEALPGFPVTSPAIAGAARLMAAVDTPVMFPIDLMVKDLTYVGEAAAKAGVKLPLTSAARERFLEAQGKGHGGGNITKIAKLYD